MIRSASDHTGGRSTPATRSTAARSSGDNADHWSVRRESPGSSRGSTVSRTVSSLVRAPADPTQVLGSASVCDEVIQGLPSVFGTEGCRFESCRVRQLTRGQDACEDERRAATSRRRTSARRRRRARRRARPNRWPRRRRRGGGRGTCRSRAWGRSRAWRRVRGGRRTCARRRRCR